MASKRPEAKAAKSKPRLAQFYTDDDDERRFAAFMMREKGRGRKLKRGAGLAICFRRGLTIEEQETT